MSARSLRRCSVVALLGLILAACGAVATPPLTSRQQPLPRPKAQLRANLRAAARVQL
jgi:hypothetical protein